ncbi:hypothetical protein EI94DRAFT_1805316 [Lactarius quietus]|nr:hypothetical protein EI94DRAFT_1805316 [Lactarius quietus]
MARESSYENATAMRIFLAPDAVIVTRVFMLFRGVAAVDLGLQEPARARMAEADKTTFWVNVVNVDAAHAGCSVITGPE